MGSEIAVAGWLAALLNASAAKLTADQHLQDKAVEQNLKKLQFNLNKIITAAQLDQKQIGSQSIKDWFSSFKDAIYAADDVIEELVQQLEKHKKQSSTSSTLRKSANLVSRIIQARQFNGDDMKQLDEVTKTFDGLVSDIFELLKVVEQLEGSGWTKQQEIIPSWRLTTSPYKGRTTTTGRASERDKMMEALLQEGGGSTSDFCKFSVVCVVGSGGIGKTDLARFAYNNEEVRRHFNLQAWVTVCNNFDVKRLTIEIIESASVKRPSDLHNITSLEPIQNTLAKGMKDKKILIVLDDVWEDSNTSWELLTTPFTHGSKGSRIIVTTQLESVAKSTKAKETIHLDGLEEQEYFELFEKCAFGDKDKDQQLKSICREIAQKYDGSPLAAVSIGLELRSDPTEEHWRRVARNKLGVVERREGDIVSVLGFSFEQLPARLKQCYLACALFPKKHCFYQNQLIRIWTALRFISADGKGGNPVDELASKSFFVNSKRKEHGQFVFHAVLHELADLLCDGEFFRVEDEAGDQEIKIPQKARHVYVSNANNFVRVSKALAQKEQLRSLVIDGSMPSDDTPRSSFMDSLETVLKNCKFLRLLMLPEEFPLKSLVAIGRLSYLRCLDFQGIQTKPLPQYLESLNLLQWPDLKHRRDAWNLDRGGSRRGQQSATGSE
ncbi:putative disease resistance RPP13-like protein 1 [Curcuma longa]|uniref:putative disease resistance RPP13-like protein 1 n=1 Tax=Curcuma longa TaxID=136217 RepID=UPI003D9E27F9